MFTVCIEESKPENVLPSDAYVKLVVGTANTFHCIESAQRLHSLPPHAARAKQVHDRLTSITTFTSSPNLDGLDNSAMCA